MAFRFGDSFSHYSAAQVTRKWTTANEFALSAGSGRLSSDAMVLQNWKHVIKTLDDQATWIVGAAFKFTAFGNVTIFTLLDSATVQIFAKVNSDGRVTVVHGDGTVLGTSAIPLALNAYQYIELKATIHNSTGSFELRINGVNRASGSNLDTQNSGNAFAASIRVGDTNFFSDTDGLVCDLYICDGTGSANNNFLGDVRVERLLPNAAGTFAQWTVTGAGANFQAVDENPANDDTDYVASSTAGQKDTYNFANLGATPSSIKAVQVCITARKDDAGSRVIAADIISGATEVAGNNLSVSNDYVCLHDVRETDPNTGSAWTASALNAAEFGVRLIS